MSEAKCKRHLPENDRMELRSVSWELGFESALTADLEAPPDWVFMDDYYKGCDAGNEARMDQRRKE